MPGVDSDKNSPLERSFFLAEWFASRPGGRASIHDVTDNFPEYKDSDSEASRKMLGRDLTRIKENLKIEIEWNLAEATYTTKPPHFTRNERVALLRAMSTVRVDGIAEDAAETEIGHAQDQSSARIAVRLPLIVAELHEPISEQRVVEFWYKEGTHRSVEPYRVGRGGIEWYLRGRDRQDNQIKHFRLDRILENPGHPSVIAVGDRGAFEVPEERDLVGELDVDPNEWGRDTPLEAEIAMSADLAIIFCRTVSGARSTPSSDDQALVTMTVRHYAAFISRVLSLGSKAQLVSPPELVEMLVSSLTRMSRGV